MRYGMKTGFPVQNLAALTVVALLAACPAIAADAPPPVKADRSQPSAADGKCDDCGIIEAIVQRPIGIGANGYFVYDIHIRMDKTKLMRKVTMPTDAALDKGQHVHLNGGNVVPAN